MSLRGVGSMSIQWRMIGLLGLLCLTAGCGTRNLTTSPTSIAAIEPEAAAKPPEASVSETPVQSSVPVAEPATQPNQSVRINQASQSAQLPLSPGNEPLIPVPVLPPPPPLIPDVPQVVQPRDTSAAPVRPAPSASAAKPTVPAGRSPQAPVAASPAPATPATTPPASPQAPATQPAIIAPAPAVSNPAPSGNLANQIAVSGVIQIGGQTSAIIEVPNEATSRYVNVGDNLANGAVEVKRIEVGANQEPVVVLEQDGVEVYRPVGQ
jgi:hypothetical protein